MVVYGNRIAYIERFVNVTNHALLQKFSDLKVVIAKGIYLFSCLPHDYFDMNIRKSNLSPNTIFQK